MELLNKKKNRAQKILGAINGVKGIVNNKFISLNGFSEYDLSLIAQTPGAALGSTRDKPDEKYCLELIKILNKKKSINFIILEVTTRLIV